jgi:hypothetical protein
MMHLVGGPKLCQFGYFCCSSYRYSSFVPHLAVVFRSYKVPPSVIDHLCVIHFSIRGYNLMSATLYCLRLISALMFACGMAVVVDKVDL